MSAGTPLRALRIPRDVEAMVEETILRRNANSPEAEWTFTEFCLRAIIEKVLKMDRCAGRPRRDAPLVRRNNTRTACDDCAG